MSQSQHPALPKPEIVARHDRAVGERIRAFRKQKRMSLEQLSAASGLSIGYLSQIERGISSASVRALAVIASGIGTGFDRLFLPQDPQTGAADAFAFTMAERHGLGFWRDGIEKELLTPGAGQSLNLYLVTLSPGGCSGEAAYSHDGVEAGFVLEGAFELTVDGETKALQAGDAFRFRSGRLHRFQNPQARTCRILWVLAS